MDRISPRIGTNDTTGSLFPEGRSTLRDQFMCLPKSASKSGLPVRKDAALPITRSSATLVPRPRPGQLCHLFGERAAGIVMAHMRHELINEMPRKGREETSAVPGCEDPAADTGATPCHGDRLYAFARYPDI